jgi:flagellar hook assembly protein FlgD
VTTVAFELREDALVTIRVYDALGQLVATLADGEGFTEGENSVAFDGSDLSSGLYYYRVEARNSQDGTPLLARSGKMLLLR